MIHDRGLATLFKLKQNEHFTISCAKHQCWIYDISRCIKELVILAIGGNVCVIYINIQCFIYKYIWAAS